MAKKNQSGPTGYDAILRQISGGAADAHHDAQRRRRALKKLEQAGSTAQQARRVAMYYASLERAISPADILPFTSMLKSVGKVVNLDLVIHSPGGDGLTAEKMLDLCRRYCSGELRVVVPLYAKSAATLLALGADRILMGETSELGPIDAQVFIIQDSLEQQVSADHFLRAEAEAKKTLGAKRANRGEKEAARIYLASLSPAFMTFCRDQQQFGKDSAAKQLRSHMFAAEYRQDQAAWGRRIDSIVDNLSASSKHLSHGRMITAQDALADPDLTHLKITSLAEDDPYWIALYDLLQRTEAIASSLQFGKILFANGFQLVAE
jgi:hypothetical protein